MKFELGFASNMDADLEYAKRKLKGNFKKFNIFEEKNKYNNVVVYIEIETLKELSEFIDCIGSVVLDSEELTVYDDYLE